MALTQTDLDNLESAMASGALTVEIDGERVTYRSIEGLRSAIAYTKGDLAAATAAGAETQSFATFPRR